MQRPGSFEEAVTMDRKIVYPGQLLSGDPAMAGRGTYVKNGKVLSLYYGVSSAGKRVNVVPFSGKYHPAAGDHIIGKVIEVTASNWIFDLASPYDGLLHVSEYPRRVESSAMRNIMDIGDCAILRIKDVSSFMKVELTMKEHGTRPLMNGLILEVQPTKVPRIIGHSGSMVSILKKETNCEIFIGQNGRVWIRGSDEDMERLTAAIHIIENESHISGLTERISHFLEKEGEEQADMEDIGGEEDEAPSGEESEEEKDDVSSSPEVDYTEDACRKMDVLLDDEMQ
jgi:exosome complex component RRP4